VKLIEEGHPTVLAGLSSAEYSRLAEELFLLAAISRDPKSALELIEKGDEYQRLAALDRVCRAETDMAVIQKDNDCHRQRLIADAIHWQEMLERLVELKQEAAGPDEDAVLEVAKQDCRQRAANVRQHAIGLNEPDSKEALIELAESYDKLPHCDAGIVPIDVEIGRRRCSP
jgi:hypothetical protein